MPSFIFYEYNNGMNNLNEILNKIGRKELCAALKVGEPAISNAIAKGKLPAAWYPVVKSMTDEKGIALSFSLFSWKMPTNGNHPEKV